MTMTRHDAPILMPLTDMMEEIALSSAALRERSIALREMSRASRERTKRHTDWLRQARALSGRPVDRAEIMQILVHRLAPFDPEGEEGSAVDQPPPRRPARSTLSGS